MSDILQQRLSSIRAIVTDVDGCLTDGTIYYTDGFKETKAFNCRDGLGIKLAQDAGFLTAIITGRKSQAVARRARELSFTACMQGCEDKELAWKLFRETHDLRNDEIAYLGDDIVDLPALRRAGCSFAPADADSLVLERVDVVLQTRGGHGALREMVETIMQAQGKWQPIVDGYDEKHDGASNLEGK